MGKPHRHSLAVAILLALLALLGVAVLTLSLEIRPNPRIPSSGAYYTVKEGSGASAVAQELQTQGLLRSAVTFKILAHLEGKDTAIKSGSYLIKPSMDALAILRLLVLGRQALVRVTVPEGYTLGQTALLLESRGILSSQDFVAAAKDPALMNEEGIQALSCEGYLFPDTYFFPKNYPAADAVRTMIEAFRKRVAESIPEIANTSAVDLQSRVVLASIVEREYRVQAEAPLMASVFFNRIKIGMALQSCATVVYVLTEKMGKPHPEVVYDRDLKIADSYNTYMNRGLPPGPICSPGLTAIRAAFYPASSTYLYFRLVDSAEGIHHFSESLEEHNQAAAFIVKKVGG